MWTVSSPNHIVDDIGPHMIRLGSILRAKWTLAISTHRSIANHYVWIWPEFLANHAVWICMHFVHIPMVIRLLHELPIDASIRHPSWRIRKPPVIVVHCLFVRPRREQHISHSSVAVPLLLDAFKFQLILAGPCNCKRCICPHALAFL